MFIVIFTLLAGLTLAAPITTQNGFTARVDDQSSGQLPASTIQNQVNLFFQLYPQISSNYVGAPTAVNITMDPDMPTNSAGIELGGVWLSVAHLQSNANDSGYMQFALQSMLGGLSTKAVTTTKAPTTIITTKAATTKAPTTIITTKAATTKAPTTIVTTKATTAKATTSSPNTYIRNGLTLIVQDNSGSQISPSTIQTEINAFFQLYPQATSIRGGTPTTLTLIFDPNTTYVAASADHLSIGVSWLVQHPNDTTALSAAINQSISGFPYQKGGITINIQDLNSGVALSTIQSFVNNFFATYPEEVQYYKPIQEYTNLTFIFDPSYTGDADTEVGFIVGGGAIMSGAIIRFGQHYYIDDPQDVNLVTHEAMHVTQFGGATTCSTNPSWMKEGTADFARNQFGINNSVAGWVLPKYSSSQNYTDGYATTAAFLIYVKQQCGQPIENLFFSAMQKCTYSASSWTQFTGKTVDQWWQLYANSAGK